MQAGDKITEIDGHSIHLWEEVSLNNLSRQTGDIVEVTYERDGKSNTVAFEARKLEGDSYAKVGILLTANLGVMNLIPFPALDGGRLKRRNGALRGIRTVDDTDDLCHV